MALKIRLRQQGRNNRAFFRLVVADVRSPRDGKYLEALGWYNPLEQELDKLLSLNDARIQYWLDRGAQLSECVTHLLAKGSPALLKQHNTKQLTRHTKAVAKRKALRKKQAA